MGELGEFHKLNIPEIKAEMNGLSMKLLNFTNEHKNGQITTRNYRYNRLGIFNRMHEVYRSVMVESNITDVTFEASYQEVSI